MDLIRKNIPNLITCINVLSGCASIICASKGNKPLWGLNAYEWGFIFIGIAAVADFLDGFSARLLKSYSPLGKELDSLCDLVSFGVAPAMLLYSCLDTLNAPEAVCWSVLIIPIFGALRLARFNIDTRQATSFIGLPIPANAIFWIGYVAWFYNSGNQPGWTVLPVIILESWMMVSGLHLFSLKFKSLSFKENWYRFLLVIVAVGLVAWLGVPGLMWLILYYVVWGLLFSRISNK